MHDFSTACILLRLLKFQKGMQTLKARRQTFPGNKQFMSFMQSKNQESIRISSFIIRFPTFRYQTQDLFEFSRCDLNQPIPFGDDFPGVVESMLPTWRSGTPSQQRGWRFWVDVCGYLRRVRGFFWLKCMEMLQHSLQACRWNVVFMTLCQCFCMNLFLGTRIKLVESFFVGLNFLVPFFGRSVFCATEILLSSGLIVDYLHTMPGTARVKAWWQPCVLWCIKIYQSSNSAWLI